MTYDVSLDRAFRERAEELGYVPTTMTSSEVRQVLNALNTTTTIVRPHSMRTTSPSTPSRWILDFEWTNTLRHNPLTPDPAEQSRTHEQLTSSAIPAIAGEAVRAFIKAMERYPEPTGVDL